MPANDFLDRFKIHLDSFQEGFDLLCSANSLEDLAKQFCHILRGNLFVKGAGVFHKENGSGWRELFDLNMPDKIEPDKLSEYDKTLNLVDDFPVTGNLMMIMPMLDGSVFAIVLNEKLSGEPFGDSDKLTLQLFSQLLNNSYQAFQNRRKEKELIFNLNHRVLQLNSLIDTGIEISKLVKNESLYNLALERAAALTNASRAMLRVKAEKEKAHKFYFPAKFDEKKEEDDEFKIEADLKFQNISYNFQLFDKESRFGRIPFEETDNLLLDAFGRQVLGAIENNFLHQEELEKQRIEQELSVAGSIQRRIIPDKLPEINGYDIAGINIPSKEVGGDYYDCKILDDGRYALIIADVAGKGVPAALLVSSLNAALNAYLESGQPIADIAFRLNKQIYGATPPDKYITFFIALLTPETGDIEILNAGHNPIFLLNTNKEIVELTTGGVAFGMLDMGLPFESEKLTIRPGEKLILYTDGIPEAMNENEEEYADQTLVKFFKEKDFGKAKKFIDELMVDIKRHTGNTPQSDDITALYLIRN